MSIVSFHLDGERHVAPVRGLVNDDALGQVFLLGGGYGPVRESDATEATKEELKEWREVKHFSPEERAAIRRGSELERLYQMLDEAEQEVSRYAAEAEEIRREIAVLEAKR